MEIQGYFLFHRHIVHTVFLSKYLLYKFCINLFCHNIYLFLIENTWQQDKMKKAEQKWLLMKRRKMQELKQEKVCY